MEEQLVSFETAKLAKEKGLDLEFCNKGWHGDFGDLELDSYPFLGTYSYYTSIYCNNKEEHQIQRTTQSLLQKWLREVHNIILIVAPIHETEESKSLIKYWYYILDVEDVSDDEVFYGTWEEALELGLQEALKLVKNG